MSVDFNAPEGERTPENEASMFAPTPIWARDTKKRRGRRIAASRAESDPAMDAGEAGAGAGVMGATTAAEPADTGYETRRVRRGGVSAAAIAAGVAAAAVLAGVGWYASQRHQGGVAELTPAGAPAPTQTALNTKTPPDASQLPVTRVSDPTAAADATATDQTAGDQAVRRTHRAHRRSNAAVSAPDNASNTSAAEPLPQTPATTTGTASQTETTNLNPLAGTTSPVAPATTPSASSAEPGSSPSATPSPSTTP
jgi:hypothetical protein